ncbi:MAG: A/G-specific adenine glycosylase [Terriglobia bacterium]
MRKGNQPVNHKSQFTNHKFRRLLLAWFRRHARPLPWRGKASPYAVWVSEVMLQQTQVATVIPYYRRFLRAFPGVRKLAAAPLERVLELWSGLGYYRRARHLHQAAQALVERFEGRFPRDFEQARTLPGVGRYTASAVLSIAYNLPFPVLDGNVARVVARLLALRGNLHQPAFRHAVESHLASLISRRQPGNFNQALMELGQTICLPTAPHCDACPLRGCCRAYFLRAPESYPTPRPRRAAELHYLAAGVVTRQNKVVMVRGLDEGLTPDLWNFPSAFGASSDEARTRLEEKLRTLLKGRLEIRPPLGELRHGITFRSIRVALHPVEFTGGFADGAPRWFPVSKLHTAAVSQLARKIATHLRKE